MSIRIFIMGACQGFLPGACTAAAMILLTACAPVEQWARTHERTYSAAYAPGGGSVSMTVRPWNPDLPKPEGYSK